MLSQRYSWSLSAFPQANIATVHKSVLLLLIFLEPVNIRKLALFQSLLFFSSHGRFPHDLSLGIRTRRYINDTSITAKTKGSSTF